MKCQEYGELVHAYVDDELDIVTSAQLNLHLKECGSCRGAFDTAKAVKTAAANPALRFSAPAELRNRILAATSGGQQFPNATPSPSLRFRRYWLPIALAAALVLVSGLFLSLRGGANRPQFALEREVLDSHIRSLQEPEESHLYDVKSTDQHTVKPWFDHHVDFSPPVKQLASEGFPLLGGRLDYVEGHPVSSLVYGRNKHRINLFIWPQESGDGRSVDRGFNLFHWSNGGMTFWAVSDLNVPELEQFEALIRAGAQPAAVPGN
jgi:anti-sigma factor RsiW